MITVVGGTYLETCLEPEWNRLFGSGLRAAQALSPYDQVRLQTVAGAAERAELDATATIFDFEVDCVASDETVAFSYTHCLSDPTVYPRVDLIPRKSIAASGEIVLLYGMLDAEVEVDGENVVYDPQSPEAPQPFASPSRRARRLAIVANSGEAKRLSGEASLVEASEDIACRERADVVVIKAGLRGVFVRTSSGVCRVPAYRSDFSWTLGAGDVFTAAFTKFWALDQLDAAEACDLASRAVALYASRRAIPAFDAQALRDSVKEAVRVPDDIRVYLAGPFFTLAQRWLIQESRRELRRLQVVVNSPLHDVGIGSADQVARLDLELLDRSNRVFAILDGLDPGTVFELGYARARDIPVTVFSQNVSAGDLKMIVGSGCDVYDDFPTAVSALLTTY